jgi:hypothetical protein
MANWQPTIAALQPLLVSGSSPKLTQELLARPPFRFIHDIVTELQRTGFAPGLFTASELQPRSMVRRQLPLPVTSADAALIALSPIQLT